MGGFRVLGFVLRLSAVLPEHGVVDRHVGAVMDTEAV